MLKDGLDGDFTPADLEGCNKEIMSRKRYALSYFIAVRCSLQLLFSF